MKTTIKLITFVISAALILSLSISAYAYSDKLYDGAGLLSESERQELSVALEQTSSRCGIPVIVATFDDMADSGYSDIEEFADDYVEHGDFGDDSVALVMSMADRDYWITTSGICQTYITDAGIEKLKESVVPYLSRGDYSGGFSAFADESYSLITSAENGDIYDVWIEDYNTSQESEGFKPVRTSVISIIIGAIAGLLGTSPMKSKLKSVGVQNNARNYAISDSLNLVNQNDIFLYSNVSAVPKPKNPPPDSGSRSSGGHFGGTTTHVSGGGISHGGGGGKF